MNIKTKINNWALRKLKSFYTEKETINKTKRQPSEWEKIFTNNETVKGLISKMYKQLMKVNKKKKIGRRSKQTFLQRRHAAAAAKSLQSCPTLCNPINSSPLGSSVPGILQARILEWVAISFSNAWKWKVKVKSLSRAQLLATPWTGAYQAPLSIGFSRQDYWSGVPLPSPKKTYRWPKSKWNDALLSLVIKEMQIKTTIRSHLTPVRMAIIKQFTNNKCWRGCEEREPS